MVDRFSIGSLLALATATCVALLALGLGTACDKDVRAEESEPGASGPARVDDPPSPGDDPVGGGPTEEADAGEPIDPHPIDQPNQDQPPKDPPQQDQPQLDPPQQDQPPEDQSPGDRNPGDIPGPLEDNAPSTTPDGNETTTPSGDGTGEEDTPVEENWRAPVRGSGGDTPPDFIVPSGPKQV